MFIFINCQVTFYIFVYIRKHKYYYIDEVICLNLGKSIKKFRKEKNMTQKDLVEKANISRNALINYETNKRTPNIDTLNKISNALEIPLSRLYEESNIWEEFDNVVDLEGLKNDVDEFELVEKLLNHNKYNIQYIQINEEDYEIEITNTKSNESKVLNKVEYQQFRDKLRHFIDFEFYCMKK